jgi:hypothetical protein
VIHQLLSPSLHWTRLRSKPTTTFPLSTATTSIWLSSFWTLAIALLLQFLRTSRTHPALLRSAVSRPSPIAHTLVARQRQCWEPMPHSHSPLRTRSVRRKCLAGARGIYNSYRLRSQAMGCIPIRTITSPGRYLSRAIQPVPSTTGQLTAVREIMTARLSANQGCTARM